MKVTETIISGCYLLEPQVYSDNRGEFFESFNKEVFEKVLGRPVNFVQDNHSLSRKGVLRGFHFQKGEDAQAKLISVIQGEVIDVVVDIRPHSPSYLNHYKTRLSGNDNKMLFIPRGVAHGFIALEENTIFVYKCDNYYKKESEGGIIFNDPQLGIDWEYPEDEMILSEKDQILPKLKELKL